MKNRTSIYLRSVCLQSPYSLYYSFHAALKEPIFSTDQTSSVPLTIHHVTCFLLESFEQIFPILAALLWTQLVKGLFEMWHPVLPALVRTCQTSTDGQTPLTWIESSALKLLECVYLYNSTRSHYGLATHRYVYNVFPQLDCQPHQC